MYCPALSSVVIDELFGGRWHRPLGCHEREEKLSLDFYPTLAGVYLFI
jgi:hypothetical protein